MLATATNETLSYRQALEHVLPARDWRKLFSLVRNFSPDVVVLVARKPIPVCRELCADFGGAEVITDRALTFSHNLISGARVAVVDDVLELGTTMENAASLALQLEASQVACFALTGRVSRLPQAGTDVHLVSPDPASREDMETLARSIPSAIGLIPRSFDVSYPVIECRFASPFRSARTIASQLEAHPAVSSLHDLTTPEGRELGVNRYTLDIDVKSPGNYKARLYCDDNTGLCRLVPMAIPPVLRFSPQVLDPVAQETYHLLRTRLQTTTSTDLGVVTDQDYARATLFSESLELGRSLLQCFADYLSLSDNAPFSIEDAHLIFGDTLDFVIDTLDDLRTTPFSYFSQGVVDHSPSAAKPFMTRSGLEDELRIAVQSGYTAFGAFLELFELIAEAVGSKDPSQYRLAGPYSRDDIKRSPYLRLKLGLTFEELLELMADRFDASEVRSHVSLFLDRAIDQGAVVPTIMSVGDRAYRVYRKGEARGYDEAQEFISRLWDPNRDMSLTRFAKLLATISYMPNVTLPIKPLAQDRGTVAAFAASGPEGKLLDTPASVVRSLRDRGLLGKE